MNVDMMIAAEAVSAITVTVIGITQIIKWAGVPVRFAPIILALLSVTSVLLYIYRPFVYGVIVASSIVMMGASGVYGFATRIPSGAPAPSPAPVSAASPESPAPAALGQTSAGPDSPSPSSPETNV